MITEKYKRRWIILILATLFNVGIGFQKVFFSQVNDVYADYFKVSLSQVDWLTIASPTSAFVGCILIAWRATTADIGLRWCSLLQCGIICTSYTLLAIACLSRDFFSIALIGQLFSGIAASVGMVIAPLVAVTWFPSEEVGVAMGIHLSGLSFGFILGFFVPSRLLKSVMNELDEGTKVYDTKICTIYTFTSLCAVFYFLFAITYVSLQNNPPRPPSFSEITKLKMMQQRSIEDEGDLKHSIVLFFKRTANLWSDKCFCLLAISFGLAFSADIVMFTLFSDFISGRSGVLTDTRTSEEISGIAMTIFAISHLFGGIVCGKVLDSTKRYKILSSCFYLIDLIAVGTTSLGMFYAQFSVVCIGTGLFGLGTMTAVISILELGCQHMFPTIELMVSSWLIACGQGSAIVLPLLFRLIFEKCGYIVTASGQSGLLATGLLILMLTRPKYNRLKNNTSAFLKRRKNIHKEEVLIFASSEKL